MVQFNLLPDVKLEYLRSQRLKRTVFGIASLFGGISLTILVLLFLVVNVFQKQHLSGVNDDINTFKEQLQAKEGLTEVLTVQNQLVSLPGLHDQKPVTSRLFKYLGQIVPSKVSISKLDVDFELSTATFAGSADSLNTVNVFIDTLKFTTYSTAEGTKDAKAFSEVVLSQFSKNDKETTYTVTAKFSPDIFDSLQRVTLTVPNAVTSRSETEKPGALFKEQEKPTNGQPTP